MNTTIWIIQGLLAIIFSLSGIIVYLWRNKLKSKLSWLAEYSPQMVAFICVSKIIGAIGLILPMYFNLLPVLTPIAAIGLAIIMSLAMTYHLRRKEYQEVPITIIFWVLAIFVAYNRF
jgi:hypothetical protein